ncbi:unnamed protein product [Effrenium voratum]|uniref:Uncharacterized protein n=1 Tax=Effrenium voratum TaxID=2562239 RepID=A0AA36ISE1_9DINO|nr:unnamed protein product [Effrenium voratum]
MVRIVNGQVVGSAGSAGQKRPGPEWTRGAGRSESPAAARAKGPLDVVAGFFWSVVSFFVLFFQTMFKPSEGGSKRVEGKSRVKTINPGDAQHFAWLWA